MGRPAGGYRNKAGKKIPGVTTVIGARVSPGGLMWWANRLAFEPLMEARALLRDVAEDRQPDIEAIQALLEIPDDAFDHNRAAGNAADAGTLAHLMVERHLGGDDPHDGIEGEWPTDVIDKASNAFLGFLSWAEQTNLKVLEPELSLMSERYQFGGTLDACVLSINGKRALGDWKTSNGLYPDHIIQVAAYGLLWEENRPGDPIDDGYHIFRFSKDTGDFHHHHFTELSEAREAFLHLRALYDIDKALAKRAK